MHLQEIVSPIIDVLGGPEIEAVNEYVYVIKDSAQVLEDLMGMPVEEFTDMVDRGVIPRVHIPGSENQMQGTSDLTAKHGEAVQAMQDRRVADDASLARARVEAEASFGRLESGGGIPAIQALPAQHNNPYTWN